MSVRLRIDPTKYNTFTPILLNGVEYILHLYWNNSMRLRGFNNSGWYLSLYNAELFDLSKLDVAQPEALIFGGIKLMPNTSVFGEARVDGLPSGLLICGDTQPEKGTDDETYHVTLDNFGTNKRFVLEYYTEEEVEEFLNDNTLE